VVPITIDGSFQVLPRTKGFNFVNYHRMRLVIHAPIMPQGQGADNIKALSQLSYDAIDSALSK
jgi:1-acyl-sn-glycerol-3-phosphate acyltransferase